VIGGQSIAVTLCPLTGTRWDLFGRALEGGELEGHRLEQVPAHNSMWFAWDTYWRGAPVWEGEGIIDMPQTAIAEDGVSLPVNFALGQSVRTLIDGERDAGIYLLT
jgi:hypothetical protein